MHSQCHLSAPLKSDCLLLLSRCTDALCSFQFKTSISKSAYSHTDTPSPFKIILRTYHPLIPQNKLNTEWRRHWQVLFLQRFFYSLHCLCYLSKKLENTISFPHGSFLFHLENIDFASPCDSYAAQVNMALFNIRPSLCNAIKFTVALGEKPIPLLASSFATTQNTTIFACPERLLVWLICLCMLYSSKHMTGPQELINSDVSFNNTQLQLWRDRDTWIKKLMAQNVVQIHEHKAFFPHGLPK